MTERRARMHYDEPVPEPEMETRLTDRTPRGQPRTYAGCLIPFSLPFIASGITLGGGALGLWPLKGDENAPMGVLTAGGAVFVVAGLFMLGRGIWQLRDNARRDSMRRSRPSEPWLADHPWSARAAGDTTLGQSATAFMMAAFLAIFLVPFNWCAFFSGDTNVLLAAIVAFFDLITLLIIGKGTYLLIRFLKFGSSTLVFRRFPFFLGDTLEADFRTSADVRSLKSLVFTLRCIREQVDAQAAGSGLNLAVFEVWKDVRVVEPPAGEIPVSVRLPAETHFSTELQTQTPRYWELEVTGEAPGVDFGARFLVPVYEARP
jgi:hypothetical protein